MKTNEAISKIVTEAKKLGGNYPPTTLFYIQSIDNKVDRQLVGMLFEKMKTVVPSERAKDPDIMLLVGALEDRGVQGLTGR